MVGKKAAHIVVAVLWSESKVGALADASRGWEEKPQNVLLGCEKSSDSSVIPLLEDNSHEHYTAKYPLIDIEQIFWIIAWDFAKPVCYQLSIERGKAWRIMQAMAKFLPLSKFSTTHRQSWETRTAHQFQLRSSFIIAPMYWSMTVDITWPWSDFWSVHDRIECLSNNTGWYIIEPFGSSSVNKHLPPTYPTEMADQYGETPHDYVDDLRYISNIRFCQGMLFFIPLFSKQQLKLFQVIIATLMVYDFIYYIPQQVSLSICKQWFHISLLPQIQYLHRYVSYSMPDYCYWYMKTQEEVVKTACHLFFCPDK